MAAEETHGFTDTKRFGTRLRELRRERGESLATLAAATGLTKGFLSQLEHGRSRTSVASLTRICAALGVAPGALLDPLPAGPVTPRDAPPVSFGGTGTEDRLLTPPGFGAFQVLHTTVASGGHSTGETPMAPEEPHFVHVLRGAMTFALAGEAHRLRRGESLAFTGADLDGWRNEGDEACELLWVLAPPYL